VKGLKWEGKASAFEIFEADSEIEKERKRETQAILQDGSASFKPSLSIPIFRC
jgi:hypothetical protein